ncbi:MAG: hypothetical protein IT353_04795 [Gemmatimonadaceae bacterium]|nr:hypothetical protein [Gemmatimonadaceae bacterium]
MHFTYSSNLDSTCLRQGDVIRRTSEIEDVLKDIHPHYFAHSGYRFFQVLTQSCDLVRRDGKPCKSPYITIAAVRPIANAVERFTRRLLYDDVESRLGFCSSERRSKVSHFVESLLDNNADNYFYLHAEPSSGLEEDHCAFLQLSVPLKASLHYERILGGKILQLNDAFEHKLGYLIGTSYSRVGTEDWPRETHKYKELVKHHNDTNTDVIWLDKAVHGRVLKRLKQLPVEQQTLQALWQLVEEIASSAESNRMNALNLIAETLKNVGGTEEHAQKVIGRLQNDPTFRSLIAR